ncbi:Uncharacterised protein [Mycobacterium tuberculosis]|uniref:Uncharacterized protein n=1 Tax=Mycobacterium tuberculosis TaxID=1773 RepID=A0A0T9YSR7_MYCTX|nr:Uncharacterised protein [Mycobacterium tuberculosis]CNL69347.1 Uncharacterised protein [Mycobacterium tuberculosis]CNM08960.1 Uncharacterised protein [Mycobacterium tuberculosis]CNM38012.1 Uncharacterised protein [Mycobacterium tuberculosis]CNM67762.1 Uncharacterised protein [Mycobacterium tuberculosis]
MASVSSGLRCIARLSLPTIKFSRWKGVAPATAERSVFASMRLNSRPSADTSRCTFDGKYRYSVPTATSARSATARICTAS